MDIFYEPKTEKEKEYKAYIDEHRENVLKAFNRFKNTIGDYFNFDTCDMDIFKSLVMKHDMSKYRVVEFPYYRQYFYPEKGEVKNDEQFEIGWKNHYTANPHHYEFWINEKTGKPDEMSDFAIAEMILDWYAMSMKFNNDIHDWYNQNKDTKIILADKTRKKVEDLLNLIQ